MRKSLGVIVLVAGLVLASRPASAQESDPVATWQALVNQARLDAGLPPYGFSNLLAAAAQRHADDLAVHQIWSHTGSDGSEPRQRIAEAGYAAWTWNSGELIAGENFWTGYGTIQDAMAFFVEDEPHRKNILSTTYREIGVGVATDAAGRNYYVLDFGVRPNVLPVFINDGAASTDDPHVAIRLTNETARPEGAGTNFMGRAIEVRVSDAPAFDDQPWQRWETLVAWTLPDTPGEHAVYVQFRDAAGRTAASTDVIVLGEGAPSAPTPVPPTSTPEPTATSVPSTSTPEPTATAAPATSAPEPTAMPDVTATSTPEPGAAPTPAATFTPQPPPTAAPASPPAAQPWSLTPGVTPFPTWTPLPTTAPQEETQSKPPLALLAALQGMALLLGLYLVLRRSGPRNTDHGTRNP